MSQLTKIWDWIVDNNISTLVAFERQIVPDSWTAPNIQCIDIRKGSPSSPFPVENYTIAAINEEQYEIWPKEFPANVKGKLIDDCF